MGYHGEVRIVCPSCAAAYDVADAALAPGRAVRCARCGVEWAPVAAIEQPEAPIVRPAQIGAAQEPTASPVPNEPVPLGPASADGVAEPAAAVRARFPALPDTKLLSAWLASLLLLLLLAWGAYAGRAGIMAAWPASQRLYGALGLAAPSHPAPIPSQKGPPQKGLSKR